MRRDEALTVSTWTAALLFLVLLMLAWACFAVYGVWCALQRLT